MSATQPPPTSCTRETFRSPPSEPMYVWLRCDCGHRTTGKATVGEALAELDRLHRQEVAA